MPHRRFRSLVAALLRLPVLAGALSACATAPQDPMALIPSNLQASLAAEDRLREAREAAASARAQQSAQEGDPQSGTDAAGGKTSVKEILARARAETGDGPAATGTVPGPAPAAGGAAKPSGKPGGASAGPTPTSASEGVVVRFAAGADAPSAAESRKLAAGVKVLRTRGKGPIIISAGPAEASSAFEQALLAQKRARAVQSLLPEAATKLEFDPEGTPDTVTIRSGATEP